MKSENSTMRPKLVEKLITGSQIEKAAEYMWKVQIVTEE